MCIAVREQEVHDHTQDREDEDAHCPGNFMQDWPAGLDDLDYKHKSATALSYYVSLVVLLTPDNDIKHEHNKANNAAANVGAVVLGGGGVGGRCLGCGEEDEEQELLEDVEHLGGSGCGRSR